MKLSSSLFTLALASCFVATSLSAAPKKRTLGSLAVAVEACDDIVVSVTGDCASQNANIEVNGSVTIEVTIPDDPDTLDVDEFEIKNVQGNLEVEHTIALEPNNPDDCSFTSGEATFTEIELDDAIYAKALELASQYPNSTYTIVTASFDEVEAKAWTTSPSVADSKPTEVYSADWTNSCIEE